MTHDTGDVAILCRKGAPTFDAYFHEFIIGKTSKWIAGHCHKQTKVVPVRHHSTQYLHRTWL